MVQKPTDTLRTTLVKAKDTIPLEAKAGMIYQFPCKGCNYKYVGETGKTPKTRMKQHKVAVRNRYMLKIIENPGVLAFYLGFYAKIYMH